MGYINLDGGFWGRSTLYNMYSRDFAGPVYDKLVKKPKIKYSLGGAANGRRSRAQKEYSLVPHEKVPGSNTGQSKQLVFFKRYLLID